MPFWNSKKDPNLVDIRGHLNPGFKQIKVRKPATAKDSVLPATAETVEPTRPKTALERMTGRNIKKPLSNNELNNLANLNLATHPSLFQKYINDFDTEYKVLIDYLIYPADDINLKVVESQKVRALHHLFKLIKGETVLHTIVLFDTLTDYYNKVVYTTEDVSDLENTLTKKLFSSKVKIANKIRETINDKNAFRIINNAADIKDKINNIFLRLLIICYYPRVILNDIVEKMIKYIKYIKTNSDKIATDDNVKKGIKQMVSNLLASNSLPGGAMDGGGFRWPWLGNVDEDAVVQARANAQADAEAEAEADRLNRKALQDTAKKGWEKLGTHLNTQVKATKAAEAEAAVEAVEAAQYENFINTLQDYKSNDSPYVINSGMMFYKALTNFAVSINIGNIFRDNTYIAKKLHTIFTEELRIKTLESEITSDDTLEAKKTKLEGLIEDRMTKFYGSPEGLAMKKTEEEIKKHKNRLDSNLNLIELEKTYLSRLIETDEEKLDTLKNKLIKDATNENYIHMINYKNALADLGSNRETLIQHNAFFKELIELTTVTNKYENILDNIYNIEGIDTKNLVFNYKIAIDSFIITGITQSKMFEFNAQQPPRLEQSSPQLNQSRPRLANQTRRRAQIRTPTDGNIDTGIDTGAGAGIGAAAPPPAASPPPPVAADPSPEFDDLAAWYDQQQQQAWYDQQQDGGKRRTRRYKKHAGTRRYKKRAGTRRQKKRRGTHRKRKNTTK